jgi:hypothetical protein
LSKNRWKTHRQKPADANKATFAALNIRVFEETDQTGKQPANLSTLYGKPRTKRKSQTNFFRRTKPASHRKNEKPTSQSNQYGPDRSEPQAKHHTPHRNIRNRRPNRQIQLSCQGNQQQGQSRRSQ